MNLPPEEWAEEMTSLNSQLIECLEELAQREDQISALGASLKKYDEHMQAMRERRRLHPRLGRAQRTWHNLPVAYPALSIRLLLRVHVTCITIRHPINKGLHTHLGHIPEHTSQRSTSMEDHVRARARCSPVLAPVLMSARLRACGARACCAGA